MPGSVVTQVVWIKSGIVAAGSFSGNPKKYAVVFANFGYTDFPDGNYSIHITGIDKRSWSYETPTGTGFTINAGADQALTGNVTWTVSYKGEK